MTLQIPRTPLRGLIREPAEVYHQKASQNLSSHALSEFRRCPAMFRKRELGLIPSRDSEAFTIGRAAHVLILEGRERFEAEIAVGGPVNPKTGLPYGSGTKAFADWAERLGKPALSDNDAALIEQMAASVEAHAVARDLLATGFPEAVVRCDYGGHSCQGRVDWIRNGPQPGIVDLKTCSRLDAFESDIATYGYVHQLAFYRALVAIATGASLPVHVIAVEKQEPFRCGVWLIEHESLESARTDNESAMRLLAECRRNAHWPTHFEDLRHYQLTTTKENP